MLRAYSGLRLWPSQGAPARLLHSASPRGAGEGRRAEVEWSPSSQRILADRYPSLFVSPRGKRGLNSQQHCREIASDASGTRGRAWTKSEPSLLIDFCCSSCSSSFPSSFLPSSLPASPFLIPSSSFGKSSNGRAGVARGWLAGCSGFIGWVADGGAFDVDNVADYSGCRRLRWRCLIVVVIFPTIIAITIMITIINTRGYHQLCLLPSPLLLLTPSAQIGRSKTSHFTLTSLCLPQFGRGRWPGGVGAAAAISRCLLLFQF